ncbi:LytR/AlgR family response regulator transcription factor [Marinigracilibium pacificum]|uniref:LytTR family transcriptional regulator n=1 Tax=Marinigracilibium pacificum TaxID=2729599 RepID=A0A848IU31_9BACT|nr:LytTR family DNA-binding domain-containing protein [Marinigracilibium pacificum]NMM47847.1 LytTR family transcriptional regulator [Marinigracilibium pacificum]
MKTRGIYIRLLISFILSNVLILIGKDDWISLYVHNSRHYQDMIQTFFCVFIVFEYIFRINTYLDTKHNWKKSPFERSIFQVFFGLLIPSILAIILTFIQWEFIWHKGLIEGNYFKYEFLPQVLLIVIMNLFLVILNIFKTENNQTSDVPTTTIQASKGNKNIPVSLSDIAHLKLRNGITYLKSFDNDNLIVSCSLEQIEKTLPPSQFFRANRQEIINKKNCKSYASIENGKVEVVLNGDEESVKVSQKKAASFRKWIKE